MKKILFLLFLPTLLFSQREIRYIRETSTGFIDTAFVNVKWQGKDINLDSVYLNVDVHAMKIGNSIYNEKRNNVIRDPKNRQYFDKIYIGNMRHIINFPQLVWAFNENSRIVSFVDALGIGEYNKKISSYNQYVVKGRFSFNSTTFKSTAAFRGIHFLEGVEFENTNFWGFTGFMGSIFDDHADYPNVVLTNVMHPHNEFLGTTFDGAYFRDKIITESSKLLFNGKVNEEDTLSSVAFSLCKFSSLTMKNAIFDSSVDFIDALFRKKAYFNDCKFHKNVFFTESQFNDEIYFNNANFSGETNFKGVQFKNRVFFVESVFRGVTSWDKAFFNITADFSKSTFKQTPSFDKTQLPFYLYLTNLNLKEINVPIRFDLALTDSLQKRWGNGQKCHVYLNTFTDISKIVLDASKFELVFDSTMKHDDKISVFEQVIKKCKEIGFGESTKGFDIELQKLQLRHGYPIIGNFLIWLNDYWWNFGYEKSKIFRNTGIAFLLSFLIFFFRLPDYARVYFPSQMGISDEMASKLHLFTWMRFRVALFYTALIFFTWKMEHGEVNYRNYPLKTLIIYTVFTVGIIHLAYLAGAVISR